MSKNKIIDIRIVRGEDLPAVDNSISDPYVVVKLGTKIFRTKKKKGTLNPIWNTECTFLLKTYEEAPLLRFLVHSRDDCFLGEARIPTRMIHKLSHKTEYPLTLANPKNYKLKRSVQIKGKLYIYISLSHSHKHGLLAPLGRPMNNFHLRVKAGDIVLLDHHRIDGYLVSAGTASRWNHIGIIIVGSHGDLQLLEATVDGVTLSPLEQSLQEWKDIVPSLSYGFRRLQGLDPSQMELMEQTLLQFALENSNKPYETNLMDLARGIFKANKKEDNESFFCSELVAAGWKSIGILGSDQISSNFLPRQFAKKKMKLENNIQLSSIIEYKDWADPERKLRPLLSPDAKGLSSPDLKKSLILEKNKSPPGRKSAGSKSPTSSHLPSESDLIRPPPTKKLSMGVLKSTSNPPTERPPHTRGKVPAISMSGAISVSDKEPKHVVIKSTRANRPSRRRRSRKNIPEQKVMIRQSSVPTLTKKKLTSKTSAADLHQIISTNPGHLKKSNSLYMRKNPIMDRTSGTISDTSPNTSITTSTSITTEDFTVPPPLTPPVIKKIVISQFNSENNNHPERGIFRAEPKRDRRKMNRRISVSELVSAHRSKAAVNNSLANNNHSTNQLNSTLISNNVTPDSTV